MSNFTNGCADISLRSVESNRGLLLLILSIQSNESIDSNLRTQTRIKFLSIFTSPSMPPNCARTIKDAIKSVSSLFEPNFSWMEERDGKTSTSSSESSFFTSFTSFVVPSSRNSCAASSLAIRHTSSLILVEATKFFDSAIINHAKNGKSGCKVPSSMDIIINLLTHCMNVSFLRVIALATRYVGPTRFLLTFFCKADANTDCDNRWLVYVARIVVVVLFLSSSSIKVRLLSFPFIETVKVVLHLIPPRSISFSAVAPLNKALSTKTLFSNAKFHFPSSSKLRTKHFLHSDNR
mmetsp:Transcript_1896/g.6814  ORF Transcript_1896/g.6814 Transcript_1896/m.6814 type:complete len:293 (-) Transcript_1896:2807-3685(-)